MDITVCVYEKWHLHKLEISTKLSVPFLIYAVMLSLRIFSGKHSSEQGFLFFFVGGQKYFR